MCDNCALAWTSYIAHTICTRSHPYTCERIARTHTYAIMCDCMYTHACLLHAHACNTCTDAQTHARPPAPAHTYIHTYIPAYIYTYTHTRIHTYIHGCMHAYTSTYVHACIAWMHACMHACVRACMHAHIHMRTQPPVPIDLPPLHYCDLQYFNTYIYICIYIYIYICPLQALKIHN